LKQLYEEWIKKRDLLQIFHGMKLSESLLEGLVTPTCLSLCDMVIKSCKLKITGFSDPFLYAKFPQAQTKSGVSIQLLS
jgi:hypothetical protein